MQKLPLYLLSIWIIWTITAILFCLTENCGCSFKKWQGIFCETVKIFCEIIENWKFHRKLCNFRGREYRTFTKNLLPESLDPEESVDRPSWPAIAFEPDDTLVGEQGDARGWVAGDFKHGSVTTEETSGALEGDDNVKHNFDDLYGILFWFGSSSWSDFCILKCYSLGFEKTILKLWPLFFVL